MDIKREDSDLINQRFSRIFQTPMHIDETNKTVTFDLPGFAIADFNRAGKLSFWSFMKYSEIIRQVVDFTVSDGQETFKVVAAQKLEIFPELYAKAALVFPLKVLLRPGHFGKYSSSIFIEFKDAFSGNLYARIQRQLVTISAVTRRPVPAQPIAELQVGNYSAPNPDLTDQAKAQPIVVPKFTPSPEAMTYIFRACHSDSDNNYHTNQASYFRLCCDAAASACNEGKLKNFSGDFFRYDVSGAMLRYLGESFPGDDLEVTLWESPVDLDSLFFHVLRLNKVIFSAKFSYYKPTTSKL